MISSSPIWIAGLRALIGDIRMPGCRAGLAGQAEKKVMQRFHSLPDFAGGIVQGDGIYAEPDSRQSYSRFSAFV
jgi:hypothetical protein